jgi:manganese/zinc/iron transport system permease protein
MGNLESLIWLDASGWASLSTPPRSAGCRPNWRASSSWCALIMALTVVFWRPLKISTFDEGFAQSRPADQRDRLGLVVVAALAAVAAFDAVGSIIVIAMFICPPAAARLMTDDLRVQVGWSVIFATLSAILGYVLAGYGPGWFGADNAVSAAGMIAAVSGAILGLACLFGPHRSRIGTRSQADA